MNTTVRFFVLKEDEDQDTDIVEVEELEFLEYHGEISYNRSTMSLNGVNQIELTKGLEVWNY